MIANHNRNEEKDGRVLVTNFDLILCFNFEVNIGNAGENFNKIEVKEGECETVHDKKANSHYSSSYSLQVEWLRKQFFILCLELRPESQEGRLRGHRKNNIAINK